MKRRKKTSSNVPAKGRLRDMSDQLWSLAVKEDWANICAMCGSRKSLNSHHLIPRRHEATRYLLTNGCCLCSHCHQFCPLRSPHQNAAGFMLWLEEHHPQLHEWYTQKIESGLQRKFDGTVNAAYFCGIIRRLRNYVEEEDYVRVVGVKFSQWLEEDA